MYIGIYGYLYDKFRERASGQVKREEELESALRRKERRTREREGHLERGVKQA